MNEFQQISESLYRESDEYRMYCHYLQLAKNAMSNGNKWAGHYLEMALEFSDNRVSYRLPIRRLLSQITGENEVQKQYSDLYE